MALHLCSSIFFAAALVSIMRLVLLLLGSATGLVPLSHLRPVARSRGSALSLHADCGDLVSTLTAAAADAAALKPQINELKDIAAPDLTDALSGFSNDALVYLAAAVVVTPAARVLGVSPILGFLLTGLVLGPAGFGAFHDLGVDEELAEIGILFLLFEQGLELTLERLTKLANFAFGLGALQLALCTVAFGAFPFAGGVGLLEWAVHAKPELVAISRPDEALVIGAALSLSSSAFVLQLLAERGQRNDRFALACLGVLLLQDLAVVPLLVLLPLIEDTQVLGESANVGALAASALQALAALGALLVGGRVVLRRVFAAVAGARSNETFVALCLLVVLGTGAFTDGLGLSSTLGAFAAGTLLAESNYRTQIEADIQPFKGILLGLFFVTTGASVDPSLVASEAPTALALLAGLLFFKTTIVTALGRLLPFGLTTGEALRAALLLAGGGEFAFVLLTLAERLEVLPPGLAKLDAAIVVLSMALIPALGALGDRAAEWLDGEAAPALAPSGDEAAALAALSAPFPRRPRRRARARARRRRCGRRTAASSSAASAPRGRRSRRCSARRPRAGGTSGSRSTSRRRASRRRARAASRASTATARARRCCARRSPSSTARRARPRAASRRSCSRSTRATTSSSRSPSSSRATPRASACSTTTRSRRCARPRRPRPRSSARATRSPESPSSRARPTPRRAARSAWSAAARRASSRSSARRRSGSARRCSTRSARRATPSPRPRRRCASRSTIARAAWSAAPARRSRRSRAAASTSRSPVRWAARARARRRTSRSSPFGAPHD